MEACEHDVNGQGAGPLARAIARVAGWATIGEPVRVFTTLGRNRRLFRAWLPFAATLLYRTRLPRRDVEVLILRTARDCCCRYLWVQHVGLARKAGLAPGAVAAIMSRSDEQALTVRQRLLLDAADELTDHRRISGPTRERLRGLFDDEQMLEVCMLVGHYTMLAMTLNSAGAIPEAAALAALGEAERRTAMSLEPE